MINTMKNINWISLPLVFSIILLFGNNAYSQELSCEEWADECSAELENYAGNLLADSNCQQWKERCDLTSEISRSGAVSIGTDQFVEGFNLVVKNGIIARLLKVCEGSDNWCDYVFEEDYDLMPLDQVNTFIQDHKHLHKMPSAKEIHTQGGFSLGKISLAHQEKIEEIVLHIIDLKKKADQLQHKLNQLRAENKRLSKG